MLPLFLLIFSLIIILPTTFKIFFTLDNAQISFTIKIYPLGLFGLQFKKSLSLSAPQFSPKLATKQDIKPSYQFKHFSKKCSNKHFNKHILFLILKCLTIRQFSLSVQLSLTDRPQLFKFYGLYWALYGAVLPYLPPQIAVNFQMTSKQGNSYLACKSIFSCSFGEIIFKAILLLAYNILQKLQRRNIHGQPSYQ